MADATTSPAVAEYDYWSGPDPTYQKWIDILIKDVIMGEFGYELNEFTVFPVQWHALYAEGLTPRQAWQRALDAHLNTADG